MEIILIIFPTTLHQKHWPKILPTVKITTPSNNTSTENETANVRATLKNVSNKNDITFKLNGKRVTTFNYQGGTFSANIKLRKGKNKIQIKASNQDGNDSDKVTVRYQPKTIAKPVIKFISPRRPGSTAKKKKMTARASVKNVNSRDQIQVSFNGRLVNFTFDDRRQEVSIPVNLKGGTNKISITATNDGGRATAETTMKWKDKPTSSIIKPTITIVSVSSPTANPFNPNVSGSTIIATVSSVTKKSEISISHNGKQISDFTFDARSGRVTVSIQLANDGANKVKFKATNRAGSSEKEHTY